MRLEGTCASTQTLVFIKKKEMKKIYIKSIALEK